MKARHGFTLIELLTTIAILGLLVALLVPAVQSARESSRRSQCAGNFKNIGLAIAQYAEASGGALPNGEAELPNVQNSSGSTVGFGHGSLPMYLLPYIGFANLYAGYNMGEPQFTYSTAIPGTVMTWTGPPFDNMHADIPNVSPARDIRTVQIPQFQCPSDPPGSPAATLDRYTSWGVTRLNYIGSAGPWRALSDSACNGLGPAFNAYAKPATGSVLVPGVFGTLYYQVAYVQNALKQARQLADYRCRLAAVRDGLSTTIFMGEALPDCAMWLYFGWGYPTNLSGRGNTLVPLNFNTCNKGPANDGADPCSKPFGSDLTAGFRSRHPGGVSFLMGDGRIVFLSEIIDHETLQRLGAKADGQVLDEGKL